MKTLCVAIVVLSLTSVCQPASLACEELLKPADKVPDLSGRWYYIAISADNCWLPKLLNAIFWPSIALDITAKDTPNIYNATFQVNMYGYCVNESEPFLYENNTLFDVDSNNLPTGKQDLLLHTGCPDCITTKRDDVLNTFTLLSKRETVTAEELKEFEAQAECLGWTKPLVLKSDHNYETCKSFEEADFESEAISSVVHERLKSMQEDIFSCVLKFTFSSIFAAIFGD